MFVYIYYIKLNLFCQIKKQKHTLFRWQIRLFSSELRGIWHEEEKKPFFEKYIFRPEGVFRRAGTKSPRKRGFYQTI